jgi:hypothetical protein
VEIALKLLGVKNCLDSGSRVSGKREELREVMLQDMVIPFVLPEED